MEEWKGHERWDKKKNGQKRKQGGKKRGGVESSASGRNLISRAESRAGSCLALNWFLFTAEEIEGYDILTITSISEPRQEASLHCKTQKASLQPAGIKCVHAGGGRWRQQKGRGSMYLQCLLTLRWCDAITDQSAVLEEQESEADYWADVIFMPSGSALRNTKTMNGFKKGKKAKVQLVLLLKDASSLWCRNDWILFFHSFHFIHVQFCSMEKCIWWSTTRCKNCYKLSHSILQFLRIKNYKSVCQSFSLLFNSSFVFLCKFFFFFFSHCKAAKSFWDASLLMKPIYSQSWINLLKH